MPWTVNGIGTGYWGRSNGLLRRGVCESCGRLGAMKSYDTQSFFVIFFIPILPLGRKRIVDECPFCRRHRVSKLKAWEAGRREIVTKIIPEAEQNPLVKDKVTSALAVTVLFQTPEHIGRLAAVVDQHYTQSAELNNLVGDVYTYFSCDVEAEPYLRRAFELEPTAEHRLALASSAVKLNQPDRAWELLAEEPSDHLEQRAGRLLAVAESYQSFGMHAAALTVLEKAVEVHPAAANWNDYKRIHKNALKYQNTDKRLAPQMLTPLKPLKSENVASNLVARFVPLAILFLVVGIYLYVSISIGMNRSVYFVNGLSEPYTIEVAGQQRTLRPDAPLMVTMSEGTWTVEVVEGAPIEPQEFQIASDFWSRPFSDPTFVVNPDRTALLEVADIQYAVDVSQVADPNYRMFTGDLRRTFWGIDYPFQQFPDEIDLPGGHPLFKRGLKLNRDLNGRLYVLFLKNLLGAEQAEEVLLWKAAYDDNYELDEAISQELTPDVFIARTAALREKYPPRVALHRIYQEHQRDTGHEKEVEAEYERLLEQHPESAECRYLMARVYRDGIRRRALLSEIAQAETTPSTGRSADQALIWDYMCRGEYGLARPVAERLDKRKNATWKSHLYIADVHEALGDFQRADDYLRKLKPDSLMMMIMPGTRRCSVLTQLGKTTEADAYLNELQQAFISFFGDQQLGSHVAALIRMQLSYARRDLEGLASAAQDEVDESAAAMWASARGDTSAALDAYRELEQLDADNAMIVLVLAHLDAEGDYAELTTKAMTMLAQGNAAERQVHQWLQSNEPPDMEAITGLLMHPDLKRIALVVLGQQFPSLREPCFTLARKMNYSLLFPHHLLERILDSTASETVGSQPGSEM